MHMFFSIVWRCACAFHIIVASIFVTLYFLNFVIFWPQMYRQWVPCDCNFSYNFKSTFLKLVLSRVYRGARGLDMILKFVFVTFPTLTLSFSYLRFYERLWGLFEPNFSCIIGENEYAFDEIPVIISPTWKKEYSFGGGGCVCVCVEGWGCGGWGWVGGDGGAGMT